ncbi:MAG: Asp-tRNA(Asn)/Glu-tRNA(Gln) amidotransferase GatCAB subunit A, partial [Phycisphaerales bacterium]|nr:Asp-tRNA(Asn)/Glu-tRNA(Gln) amidotransferase GatCAB subunit A [Phycisphaerales bacterium]
MSDAVAAQSRRAGDVCASALKRAEAADGQLNALLEITADYARARAAAIDDVAQRGDAIGPLGGVPVVIKDNICTPFSKTTCASRLLEEYRSPYAATAVDRLEAAGAVVIGKANLDEFAMGSSNENSAFGPVRNPWDISRVTGGSSGGSAAAVAAGIAPIALGSDTGGSIRQPAAFCGVVGLKPTYGRVSRYGLTAFGSSLDQIGPIATNVTDAALVLRAIAGHDPMDSTSVPREVDDYFAALSDDALSDAAGALRIGVPGEFFGDGLDAEIRAAVVDAIEKYRSLGAQIIDISLPHVGY